MHDLVSGLPRIFLPRVPVNRHAILRDKGSMAALEAVSDETAGTILRESARLPEREKELVLGIVRQFAGGAE